MVPLSAHPEQAGETVDDQDHRAGAQTDKRGRERQQRLLDAHVMQIGPIRSRSGSSRALAFGFGISTSGGTEKAIAFFSATPGVEFIASFFGRYDLVAPSV